MKINIPHILILSGIVYAGIVFAFPQKGFWTTDGGNKFIQVQNILDGRLLSVKHPGEEIDPEGAFFPFGGHHFKRNNGKIRSFYPPYFALFSAPFYFCFGFKGLFILPALCGLLSTFLVFKIALEFNIPEHRAVYISALSAFASPFLFYSVVFWEEMPAVALWCVAFLLLLRGLSSRWRANFFYAGLLTGACSILREEGYLLLASAIVALSLRKRGIYDCLPVASGFAAVVLPLWVFQYCVYGNPAGIHALGYVSNFGGHFSFSNFLLGKMSNFYVYLFKFAPSFKVKDLFYGLLFFPFICACVAGIIFRRDIGKKGLAFLPPVAVASLILTLILWLLGVPVYSSIFTQGLFPAVPFMIIPVLFAGAVLKDKHPATRFTFLSVIFYVIFACLSLNQKDMGIIWGPRHFIFIIPALIPFVFSGKEALFRKNSGVFRVSVAIIFISAFLIQIYGIYSLYVKKKASAEIVQALEKLPRPIVTDIFWLPEEAAVLFYRKNILAVGGKVKLKDAIGKIRAKGVNSFGLVLSNKFRRIKDKELAETLNSLNVTGCERLNLPDTPFLNLVMLNCSTGP